MKKVKMFLFARWIATCYYSELNTQPGLWWKERLEYFNRVVYPNLVENETVTYTKDFLRD